MANYDADIDVLSFLYSREISFTNSCTSFKNDLIVKLTLNENNFNFDLIEEDCGSFRVRHNGHTLRMWLARWDYANKFAVMFLMLHDISPGEKVTLEAYWGNEKAVCISDPSKMSFLFYEEFNSATLNSSIWTANMATGTYYHSTTYGYRFDHATDSYIVTKTNPLTGVASWTIMAGFWTPWTYTSTANTDNFAVKMYVEGTENPLHVAVGISNHVQHNITSTSPTDYSQSYIGFEANSYNEAVLSYNESKDQTTFSLLNRENYPDASFITRRKREGDTRATNIGIGGRYQYGPYYTSINWLVALHYEDSVQELDTSELYILYATVKHQNEDFEEYGPDITSTTYNHESSFGGNPYLISDEGYEDADSVWISDADATAEDEIYIYLHMAWTDDMTSRSYIHYDSGHVNYYNASKLSDNDLDTADRNFFKATTSSGVWAAIKFNNQRNVGAFRIKATENLSAFPKNYIFYGSNYNPSQYFRQAKEIISGTFTRTSGWHDVVLTNSANYRYYILKILDTHNGGNVQIQEWEMFQSLGRRTSNCIAQLRLCPALYGDYQYGFPKEIKLEGTNDGVTWYTLLPWTETATPFVQHIPIYGYWQRFSFLNEYSFWSYRLACRGNWGKEDGRIIIGEWSMHELADAAYTYRILDGTTNNVQQIWAESDAGIESNAKNIYIANDYLNIVLRDRLVSSTELPAYYDDIAAV